MLLKGFTYGAALAVWASLALMAGSVQAFPVNWGEETVHVLPDQQVWVLQPDTPVDPQAMLGLAEVLRMRIESTGASHVHIQVQGRVIVVSCPTFTSLPSDWVSRLQLHDLTPLQFKTEVSEIIDGERIGVGWQDAGITHEDIALAQATLGDHGEWRVALTLRSEAVNKFALLTAAHLDQPIGMFVDGFLISAPVVKSPIATGEIVIDSGFTADQARSLAALFKVRPAPLRLVETARIPGWRAWLRDPFQRELVVR